MEENAARLVISLSLIKFFQEKKAGVAYPVVYSHFSKLAETV